MLPIQRENRPKLQMYSISPQTMNHVVFAIPHVITRTNLRISSTIISRITLSKVIYFPGDPYC